MTTPDNNPIPNFQRRTADSARELRDNLNNVIREIQPLVDRARGVNNITNLFNHQHEPPDDSVVINLEENVEQPPEHVEQQVANVVEAQRLLQSFLRYVPFILILFAKAIYDYHKGMFMLMVLFVMFVRTNSMVKRETTKRDKRSLSTLFIELLCISASLLFFQFVFETDFHVIINLVLIKAATLVTVGTLLWIIMITDLVLKLVTVAVKIVVTMLPGRVVPFQKRGKLYLFIEAVSQLYRSIVTIQPWLHYLLESYQGPEKVFGVFLSAFYMVSKGPDLISRLKLFRTAFFKLLQNVTVGSAPSKEQIQTAGEHCPICHDEYESPVLLHCRHIFCENCVTTWFDREQTCPLCRAKIVDDPSWRDGSTSYFLQLY